MATIASKTPGKAITITDSTLERPPGTAAGSGAVRPSGDQELRLPLDRDPQADADGGAPKNQRSLGRSLFGIRLSMLFGARPPSVKSPNVPEDNGASAPSPAAIASAAASIAPIDVTPAGSNSGVSATRGSWWTFTQERPTSKPATPVIAPPESAAFETAAFETAATATAASETVIAVDPLQSIQVSSVFDAQNRDHPEKPPSTFHIQYRIWIQLVAFASSLLHFCIITSIVRANYSAMQMDVFVALQFAVTVSAITCIMSVYNILWYAYWSIEPNTSLMLLTIQSPIAAAIDTLSTIAITVFWLATGADIGLRSIRCLGLNVRETDPNTCRSAFVATGLGGLAFLALLTVAIIKAWEFWKTGLLSSLVLVLSPKRTPASSVSSALPTTTETASPAPDTTGNPANTNINMELATDQSNSFLIRRRSIQKAASTKPDS